MARSRSADFDERRRHAEAFVRSLPPVPERGPLTDEERAGIEATLRRFTTQRGYRWHGQAMWVRSPIAFRELTDGARTTYMARGGRVARVVVRTAHGLCQLGATAALYAVPGLAITHVYVVRLPVGWLVGSLLASLVVGLFLQGLVERLEYWWSGVRLRVRVPRGLRPGTPQFRAWLPHEQLRAGGQAPDGRRVLDMEGLPARFVRSDEFLGGVCGRSTSLRYPVRFQETLRRGGRPAFDGHLRPHELAWLLERREVVPRRLARTLIHTQMQLEPAFAVRLFRDRAVVLEPPIRFRTERLPDGTSRVHCDDAPAVEWASGDRLYALHGVRVPADLVDRGWGVEQINAEPNSEVRRVAIERMGWATYLREAGLRPMDTAPDPANAGRTLRLYAIDGVRARVLVMSNGSPDRSGMVRDYAELVPWYFDDAVAAAAWQYGSPSTPTGSCNVEPEGVRCTPTRPP